MEIKGTIIAILPASSGVSQKTGNSWKSQSYVIETQGQYPKRCVFNVFGEDRINKFNIQGGEELTVKFDIDAHEYNGRWFNEVRAYDVVRGGQQPAAQAPTPAPAQTPAPQQQNMFDGQPAPFPVADDNQADNDDLPF